MVGFLSLVLVEVQVMLAAVNDLESVNIDTYTLLTIFLKLLLKLMTKVLILSDHILNYLTSTKKIL